MWADALGLRVRRLAGIRCEGREVWTGGSGSCQRPDSAREPGQTMEGRVQTQGRGCVCERGPPTFRSGADASDSDKLAKRPEEMASETER